MRFAHMADCHVGGWRHPALNKLNSRVFADAMEECRRRKVDFILISGDLFNSALPGIDKLKRVVLELRKLKDSGIPVYAIPGSHDFSASGNSMLDVLESAKLLINVARGKVEKGRLKLDLVQDKTGARIAGMPGLRGGLEKSHYADLDRESLESAEGFKIFMLHSALDELKTSNMSSMPISFLPKGFRYYAAGHVHERMVKEMAGYGPVVYPGPLFPNNFKELEELKCGGFYLYDSGRLEFIRAGTYNVMSVTIDSNSVQDIEHRLVEFSENEFYNTIALIRIRGVIDGRTTDIDYREIFRTISEKGAIAVLRNTSGLSSKEFEEVKISKDSIEEIEAAAIKEHTDSPKLAEDLLRALDIEKGESERRHEFEERVMKSADSVLDGNPPMVPDEKLKYHR